MDIRIKHFKDTILFVLQIKQPSMLLSFESNTIWVHRIEIHSSNIYQATNLTEQHIINEHQLNAALLL